MEVYKKILDYIAKKRIHLEALAKETGIAERHLRSMLTGNMQIDIVNYYIICKALKVPLNKFMEE